MNTNTRNTHLQEALDLLMAAGQHLNAAGFPELPTEHSDSVPVKADPDSEPCSSCGVCHNSNFEETKSPSEKPTEDCIILNGEDFSLLMQDLVELGNLVDMLLDTIQEQNHQIHSLLEATSKLDCSSIGTEFLKQIQEHSDHILSKWGNASLIPVTA